MATGTPVWRDIADAAVLAALEPAAPAELDPTPDVLVVGGGMVGLATAAMCTRAGLGRVQLIERDGLAEAASGRAAAMLSPEPHVWTDPPAFVELGRASFDLWRALDVEWSGALGVEPCGWLVALTDPIPAGVDLGSRVEVLDSDGAHAAEPELGEVAGGLLVKDQGRVHPLVAASAFAARIGSVGSGVEMLSVETSGGRVTTVHTSHGNVQPRAVVFATGLAPTVDGLVIDEVIDQRWIKGHLLATAPAPFRLRASLAAMSGLVVQLPTGELIAGGTLDEGDDEPVVRDAVIKEIRDGLVALLPRAAALEVAHAWCCFRPATADQQPVIDRVPGLENAWVTCGHFRTGILMAPATGVAIARWIATGTPPPNVEAFNLARFATTGTG